jgi:hypothetical protein
LKRHLASQSYLRRGTSLQNCSLHLLADLLWIDQLQKALVRRPRVLVVPELQTPSWPGRSTSLRGSRITSQSWLSAPWLLLILPTPATQQLHVKYETSISTSQRDPLLRGERSYLIMLIMRGTMALGHSSSTFSELACFSQLMTIQLESSISESHLPGGVQPKRTAVGQLRL